MARYGRRGSNGRYQRYDPFYDPRDEVRCAALQAHSNRLSDMVGHQMRDRDAIRRILKRASGEHPDLTWGKRPGQRRGQDSPYPQVIDDLINASYEAHIWNRTTGWNPRG